MFRYVPLCSGFYRRPQRYAPAIFSVMVFILMRFQPSTRTRYDRMRVLFYSLLRAFLNRCVFVENGQRISVDGKPKCIEMYAFSNENALDWTRPCITIKSVSKSNVLLKSELLIFFSEIE